MKMIDFYEMARNAQNNGKSMESFMEDCSSYIKHIEDFDLATATKELNRIFNANYSTTMLKTLIEIYNL